jgi:hypothetical protein
MPGVFMQVRKRQGPRVAVPLYQAPLGKRQSNVLERRATNT